MKNDTLYEDVKEQKIPKNSRILKDEIIRLTKTNTNERCPHPLRWIEVYSLEKDEILVFLANNMKWSATTVAAIYKDRRYIELFFKALKQNLKIKAFVGTSASVVKIQILTALIAMVIQKYVQLSSKFAGPLSNLVALLLTNLFTYRDIWT
ncbi:Transposase DDE domain protein [Candidatus Brocadiaceae bacterium B188]|nr:transposase [Candidatus Brocadia sapporoensis]QQR65608.1 MAG: transposase [Candidatus Brocadia sp.]RZV59893.1 MAG: hypothetical protein EX330_01625 [Candidatus Brocadia sp. BROELEC01]TWU49909.1 Transposase DDE domain protein [Candidatus Brocadiaceae bacterium B188]